jgi:2,3-bisphosphoglycerate-dependent phosphoglycerate mutase
MTSDEISLLNIPTAVPLVYELDEATLAPVRHYYLEGQAGIGSVITTVDN